MPENIIQIDQNLLETRLDRLITEKMTQILNAMLDAEADEITGAARYERSGGRKAYRAGHYERKLTAKAGRLELKVPKLKGALFESAVIERYRRREQSVEESLIDMYLAGVIASAALKAVFAMESRESALDKAEQVAAEMRSRRLRAAANCLREGVGETTTYLLDEFPDGHRRRIRTNKMIERLNREIRRRTRVVGGFPDGNSALMLVCARIRYVTANEWSTRRYLDMSRFDDNLVEAN